MNAPDPISQAEAERQRVREITLALVDALRPLRPTPADFVVTACMRVLAAHIAALPEEKRQRCIAYVHVALEDNVDFFIKNPVIQVVRPS